MIQMLGLQIERSAIGIDVDGHEYRAVQLARSSKGITPIAWAVFPRRDESGIDGHQRLPEADELQWAASVLSRRGFIGNSVSIAPSTAICSSHVLELPPASSGAPIDQLARMEVARELRCAPNEFELGHWELPGKGRSQETLAVSCPRSGIDQMMQRFESGGFTPVGIDLMELAICRGEQSCELQVSSQGQPEINASLRIGWRSSLAVLSLGSQVIYVRRIEHGAQSVWDIATQKYKLSDRAAEVILNGDFNEAQTEFSKVHHAAWSGTAGVLSGELDIAIAYISHSYRMAPFGKISISGYGCANPVIERNFDEVLGIPIVYAAPQSLVTSIGSGESVWGLACKLSTAYGLAARFDT